MSTIPSEPVSTSFSDRLCSAIERAGAPVCVGLDPVAELLPPAVREAPGAARDPVVAIAEFGRAVLRAIAGFVPVVKMQSACYERFGARGIEVLDEHIIRAHELGLLVVLDAKRADIGTTSAHYAAAARRAGADALTVSPYLGRAGIEPFLDAGLGLFVLVRTSNPDSDEVQALRLADGRTVAQMIADLVASIGSSRKGGHGLSDVGAVVGATKSVDARELRARMPDQCFLIPGYGAQGGKADDVRAMVRPGQASMGRKGVLVTASRSVIYAKPGARDAAWTDAVRTAAESFAGEVADVVRGCA